METSDKIYVAGHTGLVGSALVRRLQQAGYRNLVLKTHAQLDLTESETVRHFFSENRPRYVLLAAARVGGILANKTFPANFLLENLRIQTNVIHESWRNGTERLLFLGSSCIYPREAPQPLREECFMEGALEFTNRAYAVAKIAGIEMAWAYNRQYGSQFLAVMPTNLYGPGDRYDLKHSHLIPALIRKMHEAKIAGSREVVIWGSGTPRREFLHSEDAADACIFILGLPQQSFRQLAGCEEAAPLVNVGCGEDMTVRELAELLAEVVGIKPSFVFDASKPDGTPRKLLDVKRLTDLGWKPKIGLREGLRQTYADFCLRAGRGPAPSAGGEPAESSSAKSSSGNSSSNKSSSGKSSSGKSVSQCAS